MLIIGLINLIRLYLLKNGSLLITSLKSSDAGRYRCNASNTFAAKTTRSVIFTLAVKDLEGEKKTGLYPRLQRQIQNVKAGETLRILCASYGEVILWTFTPKNSPIPIKILNVTNQLQFVNVSIEKHEGTYQCSAGSDKQVKWKISKNFWYYSELVYVATLEFCNIFLNMIILLKFVFLRTYLLPK